MNLREKLEGFTKEELLDEARSLELKGYSRLRKGKLIDSIVTSFCSEEMLRSRLVCLTKEQINLYRKACISPTAVSVNEVTNALNLYMYWLGYFDDPTDNFCVFEDIAEVFKRIDDEEFKRENIKKGWMMKCIKFFSFYYGVAPIEIIHKMYKQKVKCSLDEMIEMLEEMPTDIVGSILVPMEVLGLQNCPINSPLYAPNGILIHMSLFDDDELENLLIQQRNKEFFIPSEQILDEICTREYEASSPIYKKLETYFRKRLGLSYELAVTWCLNIWSNSYEDNDPTDIFSKMSEANILFKNEREINDFLELLMKAHNGTRLRENRGHKPDELVLEDYKGGMPTIVPGSSTAAALLKDAEIGINAMGFSVDFNSGADVFQSSMYPNGLNNQPVTIEKKIYPNDPCICGSGKKYKKCCGKFK
jgi:hypothetical protein